LSSNWRDVKGFEGIYKVSETGIVRSMERMIDHPLVQIRHGKTLKQIPNHKGYMRVPLSYKGKTRQEFVHKLVAQAFVDNHLNKPQINHIDGNKLNNHYSNLEWVTNQENCKHAAKLGLRKPIKGSLHHNTVLNEDQVIELKQKREQGLTYSKLMDYFNITKSNVSSICSGRTWNHIKIKDGVRQ